MLRSYATQATKSPGALELLGQPAPVYVEGYGFIPPSQVAHSLPNYAAWLCRVKWQSAVGTDSQVGAVQFSDVSEPFGYSQLQGYGNDQVGRHQAFSIKILVQPGRGMCQALTIMTG